MLLIKQNECMQIAGIKNYKLLPGIMQIADAIQSYVHVSKETMTVLPKVWR